jgi:hypothetical protein
MTTTTPGNDLQYIQHTEKEGRLAEGSAQNPFGKRVFQHRCGRHNQEERSHYDPWQVQASHTCGNT